MTRQAYVVPEKKVVIFWTPKAACTTIATKLCTSVFGANQQDIRSAGGIRGWLRHKEYWRGGREARRLCRQEGWHSIGLIRDPYDRLVSAYFNKFIRGSSGPKQTPCDLEHFALNFYNEIKARRGDIDIDNKYDPPTFREFVNLVCDKIDARGDGEPNLNHHWNTQIPFHFMKSNFSFNEIYSLEKSAVFFERLSELVGSSPENSKLNRTKLPEGGGTSLVDAPGKELTSCKQVSKRQFFETSLRERVHLCFDVDYEYLKNSV